MNRKQKIIVSITGIFIVLLALVGLTYAYFLTRITGNENDKSISVTTANLQLVYNDGTDGVIGGEKILPSNTVYTKTFTVKNEGNANIDYGVYLIDVINTFERKDDIKYTLECTTDGTLACGKVETETTFPSGISELSTATIESKKTHTYTFKFTYKDTGTDQSVDMNKELVAKIQIFGENNKGLIIPHEQDSLAYNIINNASNEKNGTLLVSTPPSKVAEEPSSDNWDLGVEEKIYYDDENVVGYAETQNALRSCYVHEEDCDSVTDYTSCTDDVVGKYIWNEAMFETSYVSECENGKIVTDTLKYERVLSLTQDDYGTSYYYRGDVKNNYVNFAGMCWRIVRIAGDGSTKLILEDATYECDNDSFTGNWSLGYSNFGYEYLWDENHNEEYMIMNYLEPVEDKENSIVKKFYDFQTNNLKNYIDFLKAGDWCINDVAYESETINFQNDNPLTQNEIQNKYKNGEYMVYDSYVRLSGTNGYYPTLKCKGKKLKEFLDVEGISTNVPMYVGTVTADEVVYAGGTTKTENYFYYMLNDYSKDNHAFFTLSPLFYAYYDALYITQVNGVLDEENVAGNASGAMSSRPVVNLKEGLKITEGNGTQNNPYVIE